MEQQIEAQLHKLRSVKMTDFEKKDLDAHILLAVVSHKESREGLKPKNIFFGIPVFTRVAAVVLGVVFIGGGTLAYASEKALPGDFLYPIKIGVRENIVEASTIRTKEGRLLWQQEKLARRIHEVKELKNRGTITKKQASIVKTVVKEQVAEIKNTISELKEEGKKEVVLASAAQLIPIVDTLETKDTKNTELSSDESVTEVTSDTGTSTENIVTESETKDQQDKKDEVAVTTEESIEKTSAPLEKEETVIAEDLEKEMILEVKKIVAEVKDTGRDEEAKVPSKIIEKKDTEVKK